MTLYDALLQLQSLDNFRPATLAEVYAVHDKRYPEALQKVVKQQQKAAQFEIVESAPTYVTSSSYQDALQVTCLYLRQRLRCSSILGQSSC